MVGRGNILKSSFNEELGMLLRHDTTNIAIFFSVGLPERPCSSSDTQIRYRLQ